ncbi:MAG: NAD(+)/NADH kinase [Ruminiclostridium sp.]|jgi:NAD+ kinase|nr:NAD(+)/NADH kinase [Ruminiclostridium sp.]
MKIILCPNPFRDKGLKAAVEAQRVLTGAGAKCEYCFPFPVEQGNLGGLPPNIKIKELKAELPEADFLICFGGDGTILHAAKDASSYGVPIIGVNMGSVGFMAELEQNETTKLRRLLSGDYKMENRMLLDVRVLRDGRTLFRSMALNDAVVTKGGVARVIDLQIYGDKSLISNVFGDGVIVATPTGSTAYSLSAGGPIVEPTAENIIMTPISAHTLQAKAMVLDKNRFIQVVLPKNSRKMAYLSVDGGKSFKLYPGDTVQVTRSRRSLSLVRLSDKSFYEVINRKLERRIRQ